MDDFAVVIGIYKSVQDSGSICFCGRFEREWWDLSAVSPQPTSISVCRTSGIWAKPLAMLILRILKMRRISLSSESLNPFKIQGQAVLVADSKGNFEEISISTPTNRFQNILGLLFLYGVVGCWSLWRWCDGKRAIDGRSKLRCRCPSLKGIARLCSSGLFRCRFEGVSFLGFSQVWFIANYIQIFWFDVLNSCFQLVRHFEFVLSVSDDVYILGKMYIFPLMTLWLFWVRYSLSVEAGCVEICLIMGKFYFFLLIF